MITDLVKLSRPKHWVKNVFVFLPVPFAMAAGAHIDVWAFGAGLAAFCLGSSAVYSFNDAQDAERDRMHETKRHRPVAAGRISRGAAYAWSALLAALAFALALTAGRTGALELLAIYVGLNLFYSMGAKHIPLLDVFLLSSWYMLRVLLGCALLEVSASNWLLVCSGALALFISMAKRRADVVAGLDEDHRPALRGYNEAFLDQAIGVCASITIVAYALYTMEAAVLIPGRQFASLPFVVFGVLEYLRGTHVRRSGGSPVDEVLGSPQLLVAGAGWLAATLWSLRI